MKQTRSDKRADKHTNQSPASVDLSRALAGWYQSACTFQAMYKVLEKTLLTHRKAARKQLSAASHVPDSPVLTGVRLLEEVQQAMLVELRRLLEAMEEGPEFRQDSPLDFIEQLQLHAFHLQKQTKRIQWALSMAESESV